MSKTNILAVGVSNGSVFEAKIRECTKGRHASFEIRHLIFDDHFASRVESLHPDVIFVDCLPDGDLQGRYPFQALCAKTPHIAVLQGETNGEAAALKAHGVQRIVSLADIRHDGPDQVAKSCLSKVDDPTPNGDNYFTPTEASPIATMIFQDDNIV